MLQIRSSAPKIGASNNHGTKDYYQNAYCWAQTEIFMTTYQPLKLRQKRKIIRILKMLFMEFQNLQFSKTYVDRQFL